MPCVLVVTSIMAAACGAVEEAQQENPCTFVGCDNYARTTLEIPRSATDLADLRIELCRNADCLPATVKFVTDQEVRCVGTFATGSPRVECGPFYERASSGGIRLTVTYAPRSRNELVDGDRFTVRLTDSSASVTLAEHGGTIPKFEDLYPNGRECDKNTYCRRGQF